MARINDGICEWCGRSYEGRGELYCSPDCRDRGRQGFTMAWGFDSHLDPDLELHPSWLAFIHFLKEVKPDMAGIGGDHWGFDSISWHNRNKLRLVEGKRIKKEVEWGRLQLEIVAGLVPGRKVFIIGNHEIRLDRWEESNPAATGLISLKEQGGLRELGFEVVEFNKMWSLRHVNVIHGRYYNKYHAAKHLDVFGRNLFYGHVHTHQVHSKLRPADERPIVAMSVGCLSSISPEYTRGEPTSHMNSFLMLEVRGDGTFTPHHITIIDGICNYGGQTFTHREGKEIVGRFL